MGRKGEKRTSDLSLIRGDLTMLWGDSVGEPPHTVTVYEKWKNGRLRVFARWSEPDGSRPDRMLAKAKSIRDGQERPTNKQRDAAKAEALKIYARLSGREIEDAEPTITRLELMAGIDQAFGQNGYFDLLNDPGGYARDCLRYVREMAALLQSRSPMDVTGARKTLHWDEITPGMTAGAMRALAQDSARNRGGQGFQRATKMMRHFFQVSAWLSKEHQELRFPAHPYRWQQTLKALWEEYTERDFDLEDEQEKPRHSPAEIAQLYRSLHHEDVDKRLALMLRIGGGAQRLGQFRALMRSRLDLTPGAGIGYGVARARGRKKKKASPIFLTDIERAWIDLEMEDGGYLWDLERAWKAGEIADYPVFPAGKMRPRTAWTPDQKGMRRERARSGYIPAHRGALKPADKRSLLRWFHQLEAAAGVEIVAGRGWYGLRRGSSDVFAELAESMEGVTDEVLNTAQDWEADSAMRDKIYRAKLRMKVLAKVAELRTAARDGGLERTTEQALEAEALRPSDD